MRILKKVYIVIAVIMVSSLFVGCQGDAVEVDNQTELITELQAVAGDGVFIMDTLVAGMTRDEIETAILPIKKQFEVLNGNQVAFVYEDKAFEYNLSDYSLQVNLDEIISTALNGDGSVDNKLLTPTISYDKVKLMEHLSEIGNDIAVPQVNPRVVKANGTFRLEGGSDGKALNQEKATLSFENALIDTTGDKYEFNTGAVTVSLETIPIENTHKEITADDFKHILGTYTTKSTTGSGGRYENLDIASGRINGFLLYPGDIFSTNKAILQRTSKNGYKNAPVIENGELVDGIGGGVCQVSSTLYNAVLLAELEVVERLNHSLTVSYAPLGRDATIVEDIVDFKFKNNTDYPIYIEYTLIGRDLTSTIYGREVRPKNRTIKFEAVAQYISPPPEIVTKDPSLPAGTRVVDSAATTGSNVQVYKLIYEDSTLVEKIKISDSKYRTKAAKVRIGTGEPLPETEELYVPSSGESEGQTERATQNEVPSNTEEYTIPPTIEETVANITQAETEALYVEPVTESIILP